MNLAYEIAELIRGLQPQLEYNVAWNDMVAIIIAVKLKPVKDTLESIVEYAKLEGKPCSATSILALLSEE